MGLIGLRIAGKPPDANHPYGHRKFETLAAAGIFVFLLLVVVEVVRAAFGRLRSGGGAPDVTPLTFVVIAATVITNLLVRYENAQGRASRATVARRCGAHAQRCLDLLVPCCCR